MGRAGRRTSRIDAITARINGKLFGMKDAIGVRLQPARDSRPWRHGRRRGEPSEPGGQDIRDVRPAGAGVPQAVNQLPASQGLNANFRANVPQVFVDVDRAAAKARGVNLTDLFGTLQALLSHALHQRLQPLRPDLPGAGRGAAAVSPVARGHRPAVRARHRTTQMVPVSSLVAHRVPERAHR